MDKIKKEKILTYGIIIIICIIIIMIIGAIWIPTFSKITEEHYNTYETKDYESTMISYYQKYFNENIKITNFDELYSKINSSYLETVGIEDKEKLKEYLIENRYISMTFNINSVIIGETTEQNNIFLVSYNVDDELKYISVNESSPYNFTISFLDKDSLADTLDIVNLNKTIDDINYNFEVIESTENSIRFRLSITNNSAKTVKYDFSYLNSIQLKYDNDKYINMAAIANSATVNYEILPGSSKSIELLFNLPFEQQTTIQGAKIYNVVIDNNTFTVEI